MKLLKKLIPTFISASAMAIVMPTVLTSCGNVYYDLVKHEYIPKIQQYVPADPEHKYTDDEATEIYYNDIKKYGNALIKDDFLWSAQNLKNISGGEYEDAYGDKGTIRFDKYLLNLSSYSFDMNNSTKERIKASYRLVGEIQYTLLDINDTKSYKVIGMQMDWQITNIYFKIRDFESPIAKQQTYYWVFLPEKFTDEGFWQELKGDEKIAFNIRTIAKGYSDNGVQNFAHEDTEQAIIDEAHKYTPRLNEALTAFFMYDSYHMNLLKHPKENN